MGLNDFNCHGLVEVENTIHCHLVTSVGQCWLPHSRYLLQGHKYISGISSFSNPNSTDQTFVTNSTCRSCLWLWTWILCTVLVVRVLFTLIRRNFKDMLFIWSLCSTNERYIPIDLNRFRVVSSVIQKV